MVDGGLVVGIIIGVIALCILAAYLSRKWTLWTILREQRRHTQIFILPPPVQTHSRNLSMESTEFLHARTPFLSEISEESTFDPTLFSDEPSSRRHSFSESHELLAELPVSASPHMSPYTPLAPLPAANNSYASIAFSHVSSRIPAMVKIKTFRSESIEFSRSRASSIGESMLSPRTPPLPTIAPSMIASIGEATPQSGTPYSSQRRVRSTTVGSHTSLRAPSEANTNAGGMLSPASATFSMLDTPVIGTAVEYEFGQETRAKASMIRQDNEVPPVPSVPSTVHLQPTYVPYRPPPAG